MYAIVEMGGKQYKIEKDMTVDVGLIKGQESGDMTLDKVLMFVDGEKVLIGNPYLSNVKVTAKHVGNVKGKKVRGVKFKKRKNYTRTLGFRAQFARLKIEDLVVK
jgi:large subunit ribosomal protein L21